MKESDLQQICEAKLLQVPERAQPLRKTPDGQDRSVLFLHQSYYHFYYLSRGFAAARVGCSFGKPRGA